jgi:hypothetical protein
MLSMSSSSASIAALAGLQPTAVWHIKQHFNFLFEVSTRDIAGLLPSQLRPVEPNLGISLVNVGYMRLHAGQLGGLPEFDEITFSIQVGADLSLDMPTPRFALFDFRIGSNCEEFLQFEDTHQQLNGYFSNSLLATVNQEQTQVSIRDNDGPIFILRNTHPSPIRKTETAYGQYYSQRSRGLYQGVFQWQGSGFEHQTSGDAGRLFAHPFFREIDVETWIGDCHTQMFLVPNSEARLYSYQPRVAGTPGLAHLQG